MMIQAGYELTKVGLLLLLLILVLALTGVISLADVQVPDVVIPRPRTTTQDEPAPQLPPPPPNGPTGFDGKPILYAEGARATLQQFNNPAVKNKAIEFWSDTGKLMARVDYSKVPVNYLLDDFADGMMVWQARVKVFQPGATFGQYFWRYADRINWMAGHHRVIVDLSTDRHGGKLWTTRNIDGVLEWLRQQGTLEMLYSNKELGVWVFRMGTLYSSGLVLMPDVSGEIIPLYVDNTQGPGAGDPMVVNIPADFAQRLNFFIEGEDKHIHEVLIIDVPDQD